MHCDLTTLLVLITFSTVSRHLLRRFIYDAYLSVKNRLIPVSNSSARDRASFCRKAVRRH